MVKDHRMAYIDVGKGKPVILIHGFGGSMWHWEYQYLPLAQTHRVLIPVQPGTARKIFSGIYE
jgi:pimeloyl-ACP methyl ester carboxylesterase